jgi:ech hydrogenase subunit D
VRELEAIEIGVDQLLGEAHLLAQDGWRLVTITCARSEDGCEVIYHFDKDLKLKHLRLQLALEQEVPSIMPIFFPAYLAENEAMNLYGLRVTGLNIDYGGRLFTTAEAPRHPMARPAGARGEE